MGAEIPGHDGVVVDHARRPRDVHDTGVRLPRSGRLGDADARRSGGVVGFGRSHTQYRFDSRNTK